MFALSKETRGRVQKVRIHAPRTTSLIADLFCKGDSFTIAPQIVQHIQSHWPDMAQENDDLASDIWISFRQMNGEFISPPAPFDFTLGGKVKDPPTRIHRHSRPKFLKMLISQLERVGILIEYGLRAVEYYENERAGGVVLSDGQKLEADVVVASDGIGSKSLELINSHEIRAWSSGWAIARTAFPTELIASDEELNERFKKATDVNPEMSFWYSYAFSIHVSTGIMMWTDIEL